jgi:hypothetical protein
MTLEELIAWYKTSNMPVDEFISEVRRILDREIREKLNAVEKVIIRDSI